MRIPDFEGRFRYLQVPNVVGRETFGHERWMNQRFYHSREWDSIRDRVIARDGGYDLGCRDRPIAGKIIVHHILPLTPDMLVQSDESILDPDFLISCSLMTHNDLHFGRLSADNKPTVRRPGDTCPWKDAS